MFLARASVFSVGLLKNTIVGKSGLFSNMSKSKILKPYTVQGCSVYTVTQNITLNTRHPLVLSSKENSIPEVSLKETRPTVVLLEYMYAKKKHVKKIADIYLDRGFDVLQICLKPLQLLFPAKGSQVIAKNLADFLVINKAFSPLLIHGFSVGGYLWGETLVQFSKDLELYQSALDRIKGQIFDSPADIEAIPTAFPASVFPKSPLRRSMFEKYLRFHLKYNYEAATKHYIKSREIFSSGLVKAPTLFITSDSDALSSPASVIKASDEILLHKLEANVKIFNGSQHVMHFKKYPNEYVLEVDTFLKKIGLVCFFQPKAKL